MNYRWIDCDNESAQAERDWNRVEQILKLQGWMSLNRQVTRVLIAESADGSLAGFMVFQLIPMVGPFWVHPADRGTGLADSMAKMMWDFLMQAGARGWIAGAESAHGEKFCRMYGMQRIDYPMYVMIGMNEGGQKETVQ